MGGINHAPCNRYLVQSTRVSRALTLGRAKLDLANVALEDLLLRELEKETDSIEPILINLQESLAALLATQNLLCGLEAHMRRCNYRDLLPLHSEEIDMVGEILADHGVVNREAWREMLTLFRSGTFYGVLARFQRDLEELASLTNKLLDKTSELRNHADTGTVNLVLEENYPANLKIEFAALYSAWSRFMDNFLASSLISTEIWYHDSGHGSLLDRLPTPAFTTVLASCEA